MADEVLQLSGFEELDKRLRELPDKVGKNMLRAAVRAGANEIKKEVKATAPVKTGRLRNAIYIKHIQENSSNRQQMFYVSVRLKKFTKTPPAPHWHLIEFGTSKMSAKPFLRPAFEKRKVPAVGKIKTKLLQRLDKFNKFGK